jgi:hypothetical protein
MYALMAHLMTVSVLAFPFAQRTPKNEKTFSAPQTQIGPTNTQNPNRKILSPLAPHWLGTRKNHTGPCFHSDWLALK